MLESLATPEAFRTTQQIGDLQIKIEITVQRVLSRINEAQSKLDSLKNEIRNRWQNTQGFAPSERQRLAQQETASRAREIINDAAGKLDIELKNAYAIHLEIDGARPFYPNKVQFLMNSTLGMSERERFTNVLASAGPMELLGYATHAIGTQNEALAAAVIQANDAISGKTRRFATAAVVSAMKVDAWDSLQKAFQYADTQFQQAVIAIRTFKASKPSPLSTLHLAKLKGKTELNEDGSMKDIQLPA